MRDIAISRIMTPNPVTIAPGESVAAAKEILESRDVHHLPVVEGGVLIGILSSADLLKLHLLKEKPSTLEVIAVRQIMEAEPVTLDVNADLIDVAERLTTGSFHALPVVESGNELVGIVTSSDLINHLLMQIPRGDGSVHAAHAADDQPGVSDADLTATMRLAKAVIDSGKSNRMAEVILYLREQNRLLKEVNQAAEHYVRGQGEREHAMLVNALADVKRFGTR